MCDYSEVPETPGTSGQAERMGSWNFVFVLFVTLISLSDLLSGLSNWNNQRRLLTNYQVTSEVKTGQVKMSKRILTCLVVLPETMKMKHRWVFLIRISKSHISEVNMVALFHIYMETTENSKSTV